MLRAKSFAAVLSSTFLLISAPFLTTQAESATLKMAHWLPPIHHLTDDYAQWAKSINAASGGTLTIKVDKSRLGKPPGQYDLAKNGVRDLAWCSAGYTPGRFPMLRAAEVPFATPNSVTGSPALYNWYTQNGLDKQEFKDTKFITAFVHGPGLLHSKKAIKTLEDLNGVKIRVGGGGVPIAKALGAVAVAMSATKAHESLQRGTTTAAFFPWEAMRGFRLMKLVKEHLIVPGGLYTTSFYVTMNLNSWNKLSAAHKKVMINVGGAAGSKQIAGGWDRADPMSKKAVQNSKDHTIRTISPAEQKRWAKKLDFVRQTWIKKANAKGHDGKKLLGQLLGMMSQAQ